MVGVPAFMPVTTPLVPTEASSELLLLHVPPIDPLVNVIVEPVQTVAGPEIGAGNGSTVTGYKAKQPVASE